MNNKQINYFSNFFKTNEKNKDLHKIGAEFEFFVVHKKNFETASFYGKNGIEASLERLSEKYNWEKKFHNQRLTGLKKKEAIITLEPAAQIEISLYPCNLVTNMISTYLDIIREVLDVLEEKDCTLAASGYQTNSKISDLKLIPKKRYRMMYDYFKKTGRYAHNMMKGTASIQVTIDYDSEKDFRDKMQLAYKISPVIALLFDNSPVFEKENYSKNCLRQSIWSNCDDNRCGFIPNIFKEDFGYKDYAKYVLSISPIFLVNSKNEIFPYEKPLHEIFDPETVTKSEFQHMMSMHFPAVRAREYIEIRIADSVPYPLNFSLIALVKIMFYDKKIRNFLLHLLKDVDEEEIVRCMQEIKENGFTFTYNGYSSKELLNIIFKKIKTNSNCCANSILIPLYDILKKKRTMKQQLEELDSLEEIAQYQNMEFIKRCGTCVNH